MNLRSLSEVHLYQGRSKVTELCWKDVRGYGPENYVLSRFKLLEAELRDELQRAPPEAPVPSASAAIPEQTKKGLPP